MLTLPHVRNLIDIFLFSLIVSQFQDENFYLNEDTEKEESSKTGKENGKHIYLLYCISFVNSYFI